LQFCFFRNRLLKNWRTTVDHRWSADHSLRNIVLTHPRAISEHTHVPQFQFHMYDTYKNDQINHCLKTCKIDLTCFETYLFSLFSA
jgi:hypothetical protein